MNNKREMASRPRVRGSSHANVARGKSSASPLDFLRRLPLDSEQRKAVEQALERQTAQIVESFDTEASTALGELEALNERMAKLRQSMEVSRSANPEATEAIAGAEKEPPKSYTRRKVDITIELPTKYSATEIESLLELIGKELRGSFALGSGADAKIKDSLKFSNDQIIDGKIEGEVTSDDSLTVGENAFVSGEVRTKSVVVFGKVQGNITVTDRCELKANAVLEGDIVAGTIAIEEGATFMGKSSVGAGTKALAAKSAPKSKSK